MFYDLISVLQISDITAFVEKNDVGKFTILEH